MVPKAHPTRYYPPIGNSIGSAVLQTQERDQRADRQTNTQTTLLRLQQ